MNSRTHSHAEGSVPSTAAVNASIISAVQEYNTNYQLHAEKLDDMWGEIPPYVPCQEDAASFVGTYVFSWIRDYLFAAAREEMSAEKMPPPTKGLRAQEVGKALSERMQNALYHRHQWDPVVGSTVQHRSDRHNSRGTLRWVGYVQQSTQPRCIMAGVEWEHVPDSIRQETLHSGMVLGEHLFTPSYHSSSGDDCSPRCSCEPVTDILILAPSVGRLDRRPTNVNVLGTLCFTHAYHMLIQVPAKLLNDVCGLMAPVVLEAFVHFLESDGPTWTYGLFLVIAVFGINLIQSLSSHKYDHLSIRAASVFNNALLGMLVEKCLTISTKSMAIPEMNAGRINSLIGNDASRLSDLNWYCMYFWSAPFQLILCLIMLYRLVGWCVLGGIAVLLVTFPIQAVIARMRQQLQRDLSAATDLRIQNSNELFSGIRIVKFMGWEPKFLAHIDDARQKEMHFRFQTKMCRVAMGFVNAATPTLVIAVVFILFHLAGNALTPGVVFPTIALLNIMRSPFLMIPIVFSAGAQVLVANRRLPRFLECENEVSAVQDIAIPDPTWMPDDATLASLGAVLQSATLTAYMPVKLPNFGVGGGGSQWLDRLQRAVCCCSPEMPKTPEPHGAPDGPENSNEADGGPEREGDEADDGDLKDFFELQPKPLLTSATIRVPKGKLSVILGPTGCGKSTLLGALLGQVAITSGKAASLTRIAYVPQQPWIMNATLRENILFFDPMDQARFDQAVAASQLLADLDQLADGVDTEIGEKGINLSGGQKARVSLARAMYADRDLYLLDDPLSALDAHVGECILKDYLLDKLADKTRVLATHHLHVLPYADYIIAMDRQGITFTGSYAAFQQSPIAAEMAAAIRQEEEEHHTRAGEPAEAPSETMNLPQSPVDDPRLARSESPSEDVLLETPKRAPADDGAEELPRDAAGGAPKDASRLIVAEEKAEGDVPLATYWAYFAACGGTPVLVFIVAVFFVTELLSLSVSLWLSFWSVQRLGLDASTYLYIYIALVFCCTVVQPLRLYFVYMVMWKGALRLHEDMLRSVAIGTMTFFDTTPIGRILNRFTRDVDRMDDDMQDDYIYLLECLFTILSSIGLLVATQPFVLVAVIPSCVVYYKIMLFYKAASREVRRISSIVESPIFSLVAEAIQGSRTIAAYGKASAIMKEAFQRLDTIYACWYMENVCNRWLGIRLELLSNILITFVISAGVWGRMSNVGSDKTALLSLSLTVSFTMTEMLNWIVRQTASVEAGMNSVERILFYMHHIPQEDMPELNDLVAQQQEDASHRLDSAVVSLAGKETGATGRAQTPDTPAGTLEFQQVDLRYRDGLPLVLDGVSFRIRAGQKVGIVGRTGSGKSTLLLTFLRMVDICGGEILVNGRAIRSFSLRELRRQFAMIPQDPLLFEGTVQSNLDPFEESSSGEVWRALELVGMRERIESEAGGLEGRVLEGGSNFSVGQRQLLCLARALLKKQSGFILMDEATANIDPALDRQIQDTVASAFAAKTVITIAHRLHTVAQYDMIIVMDKGRVAEIGSPRELALKPSGVFRKMVEALGKRESLLFLKSIRLS